MNGVGANDGKTIYWHRELPPIDAEAVGEHIIEATSDRVPGTLAHRDELWERCYAQLMIQAHIRLEQEVARLGGGCAHVLNEYVDSKHDDVAGEAWLHGRFNYMLYRRPGQLPRAGLTQGGGEENGTAPNGVGNNAGDLTAQEI
jgi:hypothetical protein